MKIDDILEKIEKGEAVDWTAIARSQPMEILKSGQDFQREAEERSRHADEVMQRMIDGVELTSE